MFSQQNATCEIWQTHTNMGKLKKTNTWEACKNMINDMTNIKNEKHYTRVHDKDNLGGKENS